MMEWKRFAPPASESDVEHFEHALGRRLPDSYRQYLLSSNGGQPGDEVAFRVEEASEWVMCGCLYAICNDETLVDLETICDELKDAIPEGLIPIGEDPGGNLILLAATRKDAGAIYFWDRFGILTNRCGKNLFRIATNIEDFLASLQSVADK